MTDSSFGPKKAIIDRPVFALRQSYKTLPLVTRLVNYRGQSERGVISSDFNPQQYLLETLRSLISATATTIVADTNTKNSALSAWRQIKNANKPSVGYSPSSKARDCIGLTTRCCVGSRDPLSVTEAISAGKLALSLGLGASQNDVLDEYREYWSETTHVTEVLDTPVWMNNSIPKELEEDWEKFVDWCLLDTNAAFLFWADWYQGFLDGKPLDWELQRRVALIEDAIWKAGPEAVAEEIERIRAAYLAEKAPQAERVEFSPESQKFFTVPIEVAKPDLLGATLSQVQDALEDVLASPSNGLHDNAREARVLRRVFTKYGNDPQQVEMGFNSVYKGLTRQILNEELPKSEENLALQEALQEGARGIRATHPEVAENRKILNEQAIRELPDDAVELLEDAQPLLEAISEGELAEDWAQDIPQLINDATLPLPSGAPPLPGADETTRIFSRVSKMKLRYDQLVSKGADTFDSKGMKTTRLGLTVGRALYELVKLGLKLFGIL